MLIINKSKMKKVIFILCLFGSISIFSQENKLVELLNNQLNKEIANYEKYDSLRVVQPFHIDENKKLVLETEKYISSMEQWIIMKQEVSLEEISSIGKDINIIFFTEGDKVLVTTKTYNEKRELVRTDITDKNMFFTELFEEKQNEKFRDKVIKVFKKAGYEINSEFWYD